MYAAEQQRKFDEKDHQLKRQMHALQHTAPDAFERGICIDQFNEDVVAKSVFVDKEEYEAEPSYVLCDKRLQLCLIQGVFSEDRIIGPKHSCISHLLLFRYTNDPHPGVKRLRRKLIPYDGISAIDAVRQSHSLTDGKKYVQPYQNTMDGHAISLIMPSQLVQLS
ncbi:uncharacterized protein LAESUDRAFT_710177 [Laetiporus sulphureus 93-53]|uniref:Uncharacterized protein n=1 Tax=Laetiporus sulphureus 93-53 TaxID=1314785 RepID=A0A165II04_9APHY|nr:uncharacterized protein LAESUDRAFT_710177 [Laetiporus sulphureus 93-53]KZT13101.1 hypothetical protein LAESUDRAFT_710177 [Laetiporus sulphureus 93-53]